MSVIVHIIVFAMLTMPIITEEQFPGFYQPFYILPMDGIQPPVNMQSFDNEEYPMYDFASSISDEVIQHPEENRIRESHEDTDECVCGCNACRRKDPCCEDNCLSSCNSESASDTKIIFVPYPLIVPTAQISTYKLNNYTTLNNSGNKQKDSAKQRKMDTTKHKQKLPTDEHKRKMNHNKRKNVPTLKTTVAPMASDSEWIDVNPLQTRKYEPGISSTTAKPFIDNHTYHIFPCPNLARCVSRVAGKHTDETKHFKQTKLLKNKKEKDAFPEKEEQKVHKHDLVHNAKTLVENLFPDLRKPYPVRRIDKSIFQII